MKIGELVTQAENAYFANDVKLDAFDDPDLNPALAACYKFTYRVPNARETPQLSSIKVLEKLRVSIQHGHDENRHLVLAYYGHGKSHLALALANFFGKPLDSPEVETILQHIAHASDDGVAQNFRDFKSNGLPHMVILLRGDEAKNLPQQFLLGLETAVRRLPGQQNASLPFWFGAAERFLASLTDAQIAQANSYLQSRHTDVPELLQQVRERRAERYDLCVEIHAHLFGTRPDFGGEMNLEDAVKWAVKEYCGLENPRAAGVVVIFDEFLAFLEDYYKRLQGGGGGSALQSLLNGISATKGKSLFVGFSQRDPDQALNDLAESGGGRNEVQVLQKELNRLPQPNRYQLYSSLETVLDGYLRQDETLWEQVYEDQFQRIQTASNRARALMGRLYEDAAGWTDERFEEIVTKGCFPLHPITTTLYCNLQIAGDSRKMLQFALDALKERQDEPVVREDCSLNWVYATALADFFKDSLSQTEIGEQYTSARNRLGGALTETQRDVLKGMLLYSLGSLKVTGRVRYPDALELLTGRPAAHCQAALEELENAGAIEKNESLGVYLFLRGGETVGLKDWLNKKRANRKFEENSYRALLESPDFVGMKETLPLGTIKLGYAAEWEPQETLLPASLFTATQLKRFAPRYAVMKNSPTVIREGVRGAVIRVFAKDEAEANELHANVEKILNEALGLNETSEDSQRPPTEYPLPVVVCVPHQPRPALHNALLDLLTFAQDGPEALREFGADVCAKEREKARERVKQELKAIRDWEDYFLPQAYRAAVKPYAVGDKDTLRYRLSASYQIAYGIAPAERYDRFITQYRSDQANLRKAVGEVCRLLLKDSVPDYTSAITGTGVASTAQTIVETYLRDRWQILDRAERLMEPTGGFALRVWQHLDKALPVGDEPCSIRKALVPLLNPPFGLDYNQIALLFCAWYGMNRRTIEFQEEFMNAWAARDFSQHLVYLDRPKVFIEQICLVVKGRIRRRDADQEHQENQELIKRAKTRKDYNLPEAQTDLAALKAILQDSQQEESFKIEAKRAISSLSNEIEAAETYATEVKRVEEELKRNPDSDQIIKQRRKVENLTEARRVDPGVLLKIKLLTQLDAKLDSVVDQSIAKFAQITSLRQHDKHRDELRELRETLDKGGKIPLADRVGEGLKTLEKYAAELEGTKGDATTLATMRNVYTNDTLAHLRQGMRTLEELVPITVTTTRQLEEKKNLVAQSIAGLETKLKQREQEIERLVEAQSAASLNQTLLQEKSQYADAPEAAEVEALITRCKAVERVFRTIQNDANPPLQNPAEAAARKQRLTAAQESFAPQLSDVQLDRLRQAQTRIASAIETAIAQAQQWLRETAQEIETDGKGVKNSERLLKALSAPPAFLPEDCGDEIVRLRDLLQSRLESSVIENMESKFRQLTPAKREECLRVLQAVVREEAVLCEETE